MFFCSQRPLVVEPSMWAQAAQLEWCSQWVPHPMEGHLHRVIAQGSSQVKRDISFMILTPYYIISIHIRSWGSVLTRPSLCSTVGSSSSISPVGSLTSRYPQSVFCMDGCEGTSSPRYGFSDPISTVTFEAPELPEETLMEVFAFKQCQMLSFSVKLL